eukprot:CAMPEP_0170564730 /NCGR_PEP_ID=MMETSP0211-20121228/74662_1 /TAXON_ID=311385 /ORGANISM="Pseudokeronopsis sp., Strain OXSARD2" /LENGTH=89 /DNA_ID=CAMNT_0010884577 /DNA_START=183 /DNA_END=454 /DNA_ORIENTATION=-
MIEGYLEPVPDACDYGSQALLAESPDDTSSNSLEAVEENEGGNQVIDAKDQEFTSGSELNNVMITCYSKYMVATLSIPEKNAQVRHILV